MKKSTTFGDYSRFSPSHLALCGLCGVHFWRNSHIANFIYLFVCSSSLSLSLSSSALVSGGNGKSDREDTKKKKTIISAEPHFRSNQRNPVHETRIEEVPTNRIQFEYYSLRFLGRLRTIVPEFAADPLRSTIKHSEMQVK